MKSLTNPIVSAWNWWFPARSTDPTIAYRERALRILLPISIPLRILAIVGAYTRDSQRPAPFAPLYLAAAFCFIPILFSFVFLRQQKMDRAGASFLLFWYLTDMLILPAQGYWFPGMQVAYIVQIVLATFLLPGQALIPFLLFQLVTFGLWGKWLDINYFDMPLLSTGQPLASLNRALFTMFAQESIFLLFLRYMRLELEKYIRLQAVTIEQLQIEVTERQQAELSRQKLEDIYRRAIDATGEVPYVINHADRWNYDFVGEGILSITGYAAAEMTSDIWDSIRMEAHPRGRLAHLTFEEADRLTNENISVLWECDFLIRTRDGQRRWIADTSIKSLDDKSGKMVSIGIYQDITERKRTESELRASEERLEILHDIDRALLSAHSSEEIASSTLVRVRQLIPCLRTSVALFNPGSLHANFFAVDDNWGNLFSDESIMVEEHIVATLKRGEPWRTEDRLSDPQVSNYDQRLANEAGIRTWLALPLLYQGQLIGSLNLGRGLGQPFTQQDAEIAQGVANQLAIAIQQTQLNKELQNQLAERERLIGELGATNAELERFNYTVSHELKTPVVTIKGFLGSITMDLQNGKYDRAQKDILRVSSATDKMHDTISDLLELSRIGYLVHQPEEVDLVQLAQEALETVHDRIQSRNITVQIAPDLPTLHGDRIRLREVYENLLDNAAKHFGNQPSPQIEIGIHKVGNEIIHFVKDNGIGIDTQYHERIFGLFDKLDPTSEGTGIGLALVKRIIETHGGRIWVESDGEGKGSTFFFTLQ